MGTGSAYCNLTDRQYAKPQSETEEISGTLVFTPVFYGI